ncbi:hypothetical protein [Polaromonas sp. CG9_12]|nr:hypothetical protein [Polaromonas sp. CG9_12]
MSLAQEAVARRAPVSLRSVSRFRQQCPAKAAGAPNPAAMAVYTVLVVLQRRSERADSPGRSSPQTEIMRIQSGFLPLPAARPDALDASEALGGPGQVRVGVQPSEQEGRR